MKKLSVIALLLLVIVLSFGFVILKSWSRGPDENYFNRHWRVKFAAHPWLREVLGLHFDSDGKADYLGQRYQKILIEVDIMETLTAQVEGLEFLKQKIQEITGKETSYIISDRNILYDRSLTDEEIAGFVRQYRGYRNTGKVATLYLLYGSRKEGSPSLLGSTYQEYGIVLFEEELKSLTGDNQKLLARYEVSTALHEFGHQLGLAHNDNFRCLMNEAVETVQVAYQDPEDVIVDFCEYEKQQFKQR